MFTITKTFPLKKFWERKLKIEYDAEIEYYKKFCGVSYEYKKLLKNTDLYNDLEDITYDNWKIHILKTIENLNINELVEYSRFLNQCCRDRETQFTLSQTIFAPLIFYLVTILLSPLVNNLKIFEEPFHLVLYFIFFCGTIALFLYILIKLLSHKKDIIYKYFYFDIKETVDEAIAQKNDNK